MSALKTWLLAARPKTLPAAVSPVLLGSALAAASDAFALVPALLCLLFALLIQIATNFANDYFDFKKGADTEERIGPTRACAAGLIKPKTMWLATKLTLALAFVTGCGLIPYGGWPLVFVGTASIVCAVAYTGGPYPLGYNGLGDVFVILFFGLIAVMFTYYVQSGVFTWPAFWLGLGSGLIINNLLVVNNVRDYETDKAAGKRTLVVRFGKPFGYWQYRVGVAGALGCIALTFWQLQLSIPAIVVGILTMKTAVFGLSSESDLRTAQQGSDYLAILKQAAVAVILYGISFSALLVLFSILYRA